MQKYAIEICHRPIYLYTLLNTCIWFSMAICNMTKFSRLVKVRMFYHGWSPDKQKQVYKVKKISQRYYYVRWLSVTKRRLKFWFVPSYIYDFLLYTPFPGNQTLYNHIHYTTPIRTEGYINSWSFELILTVTLPRWSGLPLMICIICNSSRCCSCWTARTDFWQTVGRRVDGNLYWS